MLEPELIPIVSQNLILFVPQTERDTPSFLIYFFLFEILNKKNTAFGWSSHPPVELQGLLVYAPHFLSLDVLIKIIVGAFPSTLEWKVLKESPSIVARYKKLKFLLGIISFKKFISSFEITILLVFPLNI